jgi:hypothetical protein
VDFRGVYMKKSIITLLALSGLIAGQNTQTYSFDLFGSKIVLFNSEPITIGTDGTVSIGNQIVSGPNGIRISQTGIANDMVVGLGGIDDMTVKGKRTGLWGTKTFDFTIKNGKLISSKSSTIEEWQYSGYIVALVAVGALGYLIYKMISAETKEK